MFPGLVAAGLQSGLTVSMKAHRVNAAIRCNAVNRGGKSGKKSLTTKGHEGAQRELKKKAFKTTEATEEKDKGQANAGDFGSAKY